MTKSHLNKQDFDNSEKEPLNSFLVLDLFSGAGGLSEGFWNNGFNFIAHVEANKYACETLKTRNAYWKLKAQGDMKTYNRYLLGEIKKENLYEKADISNSQVIINEKISDTTYLHIVNNIKEKLLKHDRYDVDVVIGGPPCQAYSLVGRSVMKNKVTQDERNYLYKYYIRFINKFQPKIIVFENVKGLLSASNGKYYRNLISGIKRAGFYVPEPRILNASHFGCLQNRERVIIIGFNKKYFSKDVAYPDFDKVDNSSFSVNHILEDLPKLNNGQMCNGNNKYILKPNKYLISMGIRSKNWNILTHHNARAHNERDLRIYDHVIKQWFTNHQNTKYNDLSEELKTHKNTKVFIDRFKVVKSDTKACHTILAHIAKDGHYYIHPDELQRRSITAREAARIQSFSDDFYFEGPRTAIFTQIGNAVPPLMAEKIAKKVKVLIENYL